MKFFPMVWREINMYIVMLLFIIAGMKPCRIEVINTGSELLCGSVLNTNAAWLGERLLEHGLRIQKLTVVPDGEAIIDAMKACASRADVVLVSGGLGPTSDDLTRDALAELCGVPMLRDESIVAALDAYFAKRGVGVSPSNYRQAMVPQGAMVLPNDNGTAPGLLMPAAAGRAMFILLPGPPSEFRPMVEKEVLPRLIGELSGEKPGLQVFKCVGIGESHVQDAVDDELQSIPELELAYCARPGEVDVRLIGRAEVRSKAEMVLRRVLGNYLIEPQYAGVEFALVDYLLAQGLKLATAESCTGGLIAKRLTDVPGASAVFEYGWVTYANIAKHSQLGVSLALLDEFGAVSEQVVREMAEGALARSGADVALAVSGIAGPGGGTVEKPVGTVWLAWAGKMLPTKSEKIFYPRDRDSFRRMVSTRALAGALQMAKSL